MPSNYYRAGDLCFTNVEICNPLSQTLEETPLFVILDVFGSYYFAPSFSEFDYFTIDLAHGIMTVHVLPEFVWPDIVGEVTGVYWYAAMTNQYMTNLLGEMGMFTFGWGY